jgi:hypothetical protein
VLKLRVLISVLAVQVVATGTFAVSGCGDETPDSTGGGRVVLRTRVTLAEDDAAGFVTPGGWSVVLTKLLVATGPFYYYDGAPPSVASAPPLPEPGWTPRFFGVRVAHAHPGHLATGNALGEMLEPFSVDLLAGPAAYPDGEGVTGRYRSASFSFLAPPVGPVAEALDRHVVVVEGSAALDGQETRYFHAFANFADVETWTTELGEVAGCVLDEVDVDADGTITVSVRPSVWFELVDFAEVEPGTPETRSTFAADTPPRIAFAKGLGLHAAYHFSFLE